MESLLYLGIMLVVICVWFLAFKRPVYEAVLLAFVVLLAVTGTWGNVLTYINDGLSTSLLYSMVAFVAMSILLTKTKIVDSCIAVILSLIGRIRGGAGYTAVIMVLLGLVAMYLAGETALTPEKKQAQKHKGEI